MIRGPSAAPTSPPGVYGRGVPLQRAPGTVYGGTGLPGAADLTTALPPHHSIENSGSLTGHILAQGWTEAPQADNHNTAKVVLILALVLISVVALSVLIVISANEAFDGIFDGMLTG